MNYQDILRKLREKNNLTQEDMANILNISRGLYSQYEIMDKIIPIYHINTICNKYNISIDYFFNLNKINNYQIINYNLDKNIISIRIKEFRKENKLTQMKLANILNTTHSVISAYESGKNLIPTSFLYTICKKYKISADYLLGKVNNPKYL